MINSVAFAPMILFGELDVNLLGSTQPGVQPRNSSTRYDVWTGPLDISDAAGRYGLSGDNITIGFIDTGINLSHECFDRFGGYIPYYSIHDPDSFGHPSKITDVHGHGTYVASIALGNSEQFRGAAPNASIVMVNLFNSSSPSVTSPQLLIQALDWILNYSLTSPLDILSMSIGMVLVPGESDLFLEKMGEITSRGITVIAAAGNNGEQGEETIYTPGTSPDVITVGAIDRASLTVYNKSSRGPTDSGVIKPDVMAPGVNEWGADQTHENSYIQRSGTSMAVPQISGMVALLMEYTQDKNLSLSPAYIKWLLGMASVKPGPELTLLEPNQDNQWGWGIPQLSSICDLLEANTSQNFISLGQTIQISTGILDNTLPNEILFPIEITPADIRHNLAFRIISEDGTEFGSGQLQLVFYDQSPDLYGNPKIQFSSSLTATNLFGKESEILLAISVQNPGIYYLAVKMAPGFTVKTVILEFIELNNFILFTSVLLVLYSIFFLAIGFLSRGMANLNRPFSHTHEDGK